MKQKSLFGEGERGATPDDDANVAADDAVDDSVEADDGSVEADDGSVEADDGSVAEDDSVAADDGSVVDDSIAGAEGDDVAPNTHPSGTRLERQIPIVERRIPIVERRDERREERLKERIAEAREALVDSVPPPSSDATPISSIPAFLRPLPARGAKTQPPPRRSMIAGAVLGAAIGDAMGHPTEFLAMPAIRAKFGVRGVRKFELYWTRDDRRFAPYTDDTQMAEIVLRALVESRDDDAGLETSMKAIADGFIEWSEHPQGGHRAPGNACMAGARALAQGVHWSKAGGPTAGGCGSVMRAYPFGLVFASDLRRAERWSVAHSKLTHRDPIALAACAAMAVGMARILRGDTVEMVTSEMVAAACRYSTPTAAMMVRALDEALSGVGPEITLDRLRAWAAHEAIAAAVYIFARHPDNPEAAILEGANTPGDSDSIATLAGALTGARCGLDALPSAWVRDVERSDELIELSARI